MAFSFFSYREANDFACLLIPQVHLELLYYPYAKHEGVSNPFANQIQLTSLEKVLKTESNGYDINQRKNVIMRGVFSVTVISAEDLPPMDISGKADPFVVLYLKKGETKKKTRVIIFLHLRVLLVHILFHLDTVTQCNILAGCDRHAKSNMEPDI